MFTILEAVYCMVLTNSPSGWCKGLQYASESESDANFVVRFIEEMVAREGKVSAGKGNRRQVSHQRTVLLSLVLMSLHNLLRLIELANNSMDTVALVAAMTAHPSKGGMFLVGELMAQELINVLTKLEFITNRHHMNHVSVAKGTKTDKRLRSIGIRTDEQRSDLTLRLMAELDLPSDKVENALCETLRWVFGKGRCPYHDTVLVGGLIYALEGGRLRAFDLEGGAEDVALPNWSDEVSASFRGVRWWGVDNSRLGADALGALERELVLTNN